MQQKNNTSTKNNTDKKGFIYVLINPLFPKYLKVGRTKNTAEERAKELYKQSRTGIPSEYVVAYEHEVSDSYLIEKHVHNKLVDRRFNPKKEFFNASLKDVILIINQVIKDLENSNQLELVHKKYEELSPKEWWGDLSFVWQQIFRKHLSLSYIPSEPDLLRAIHGVIDHCPVESLRKKAGDLISDRKFKDKISKWYNNLGKDKELFESYIPYEPTEEELNKIFKLNRIDCSDNSSVVTLNPLRRLTELTEIYAVSTSIIDLSPISKLHKLEELWINNTNVDNISCLENLKNLKKIHCYSTDLSNDEIENFRSISKCEVIEDSFLTSVPQKKLIR